MAPQRRAPPRRKRTKNFFAFIHEQQGKYRKNKNFIALFYFTPKSSTKIKKKNTPPQPKRKILFGLFVVKKLGGG
ncbi:hypothetical protein ACVGXE_06345, partial [Escherichia coli]